MREFGPVTLAQVESALEKLGGQAPWDKILAEVTNLRKGDYSHYLNRENYEKTAFQVIQDHCSEYKKFKGTECFEKIGDIYKLVHLQTKTIRRPRVVPEKHTPRAVDIEDLIQPERVLQETYRILRDTTLARNVKELHHYHCQICGETLKLGESTPYAEAHHIMPLGRPHNGPDVRGNILCVCPNDHVLLDYGSIKLDVNGLEGIDKKFIDYHNDNIYGKVLV
jgi:predicted HNH restriction endonuclease